MSDQYPRFSEQEMQRRRALLEQTMDEAGVDHLVAYGADRSGSAVQWISQWPVTREAALLVTPGEPDHLLVQHYNHLPHARVLAADAEVEWGGPSTIERVAELLRRREARRVGLVGPLGYRAHELLRGACDDLVSLDRAYTRLRLVKSDEEIEWMRRAAELTDRGMEALASEARPGMTEWELAAAVEAAYLPHQGTNHIHYFAATPMDDPSMCVPAQHPSGRRLQRGDVLFAEISAAYWGYAGQVLRTFTIDAQPTPLFTRLHETAEEAFSAILEEVRPGAPARDLVEASGVIEENGFTIYDDLVHGYGGGYLPPVLGSRSRPNLPIPDMALEHGMCLVIQPNVITPDEKAGVQTGEMVLVTGDGAETFHHVPGGMRRVAGTP